MSNTVIEVPKHEMQVPNADVQRAPSGVGRLSSFLHDVKQEMRKVVTPNRAEVQSTTLVVIATVFLFAGYFWLVDVVLGHGIDKIFSWATRH